MAGASPDLINFQVLRDLHVPYYERTLASLQGLDVQRRRQGLLQLLGLGSVVDNQGVLVTSASDLELGLLEGLAGGGDLLVDLDNAGLDVRTTGQLDKFFNVLDLSLRLVWGLNVGDLCLFMSSSEADSNVGYGGLCRTAGHGRPTRRRCGRFDTFHR